MIGHPCDWAVSICIPKEEGNVEAVPLDSELMEELIPGLQVREGGPFSHCCTLSHFRLVSTCESSCALSTAYV